MMYLIEAVTEKVIEKSEFLRLFPNTSFPSELTPSIVGDFGYEIYEYTLKPTAAWNQKVVPADAVLGADGIRRQAWSLVDLTGPELEGAQYAEMQRIKDEIVAREQYQQDAFAKTRGYDDIKSACGYAGCDEVKFDAEGTYCKNVRAKRWAKLYTLMEEVVAGTREMPASHSDIEHELPPLVWPV